MRNTLILILTLMISACAHRAPCRVVSRDLPEPPQPVACDPMPEEARDAPDPGLVPPPLIEEVCPDGT